MAREAILAGAASIGPTTMRRNGLFGGSAPSYARNPLTLSDAILRRDPEPTNFLAGLAPPRPRSNACLAGLAPERPPSNEFLSGLAPSRPNPPPMYNGLTALLINPPPPKPVLKSLWVDGVEYSFRVMSVKARPWQQNCVYAFMRNGWPVYVGKAYSAHTRFGTEHDRRAEAIALGANELWVTEVRTTSAFDLDEAEQRMIAQFCPVLNDKHNPLSMYR
ncbi:MAG: hypothetical protein IPO30_05685 [Hyphomonadaceae bacterium]|nr:hypothetical protein [Hyphomonadaceae bacterium]